jgi:tetratricopeptide (TPR) repeat protein
MFTTLKTLLITSLILSTSSCFLRASPSALQRAEELSRQKKYPEAIAAYREHMEERLALKDRPEWENPYFYLILIGDIELGTDRPEDALKSYLEADSLKVDAYLVADRVRSVAKWYEEKSQWDRAIEILLQHRERDSLLFDSMLDRVNKAKTLSEDAVKLN